MKSFYLLLLSFLITSASFARYDTPGTAVKWNLDSLVFYSGGAVTFSGGSYNVNDLVFISLNDTLAITTNATVKFAAATYFDVNGTIIINPPTAVLFTAQNTATGYSGMRIDSSNTTLLRKLIFEYAVSLRIADCSPVIDSCIFRYNNNSTSTTFGTSTIPLFRSNAVISNCQFLDNQRGAISGGANIANAPKIIGCIFRGNNTQNANVPQINLGVSGNDTVRILNNQILRASTNSGGIAFLPLGVVKVVITGNIIKNNRYGISLQGGSDINALVSYNQIDSNNTQGNSDLGGSGIAFAGGSATSHQNTIVTGNLIRWNLWGITIFAKNTAGIVLSGAKPNLGNLTNTDTTDDGKNIFVGNTNNTTPNIDLYNNSTDSIYAQNNYWGSNELADVESRIFHKPDDAALGFVNYLPLYSPLPVTLAAFTATTDKTNVVLNWKTLTESNSDYFSIEKSVDGRTFYSIGKITASGNTASVRKYGFTDAAALQQKNLIYYRLKLADKDGRFTYSPVVSVKRNDGIHEPVVKLYPTIFTAAQVLQAEITSTKKQTVIIRFYNTEGRLLAQTSKALTTGKNRINLVPDLSLPNGVLHVKCTGENFEEMIRLIKQ